VKTAETKSWKTVAVTLVRVSGNRGFARVGKTELQRWEASSPAGPGEPIITGTSFTGTSEIVSRTVPISDSAAPSESRDDFKSLRDSGSATAPHH
jgi:hypothetical protein